MKIVVKRIFKGNDYTIGKLYIDNEYFCDTLEDTDRGLNSNMDLSEIQSIKVKNETAIPYGTYKIDMDTVSPKFSNPKYKWSIAVGSKLPRLIDVKGFEGVLIHVGNTKNDTSGCILVGENKEKGKVLNSANTFKKLYSLLEQHKDEGIIIEIKE